MSRKEVKISIRFDSELFGSQAVIGGGLLMDFTVDSAPPLQQVMSRTRQLT